MTRRRELAGAAAEWLEDVTWEVNALDVDQADWLPVGCPHCAAARAICLEMAAAWLFQCVACGEVFTLQAVG